MDLTAEYCYLTTTGRVTGAPHTIEIWYAEHGGRLYLLAERGDESDWVRNLRANPAVSIRLGDETAETTARVVSDLDEAAIARQLIPARYQKWQPGAPLPEWAVRALPVVVDLP